ncbi:MAG TPA: cytochrome c-type biogenesis CcmF C-terminal domain-containing protein [Solirubrobacteraceae bacterium]|jgi:cytochrome c-type biogenesis protein CcmF
MATVGRACLILALGVCVYGVAASLYGARTGRREWVESGRRAVYTLAGVLTVAFAVLEIAFLRDDFSFATVATHSSTTTPTLYKAAAAWSSQEGSLLLWAWLLSVWSSLVLFLTRKRMRDVAPYAAAVLLGFGAFFTSLLVFLASPFGTLASVPNDGTGLNPLLRHPSMMIHPPMLYSGYTLFTVPFAFAVGALITRRVDAEWIRSTRRFALAAWLFLGIGVLLGARWSYSELGWGGYWAWDPVENASLMPWLTGTAFLHSVMIQERRGMLKVWNVSLVLATGVLAILGTFLVRSGILDSIHAFGQSTLGVPFVVLIATLAFGSIWLVMSRRDSLRSEHRLDSLLSREAVFLLNNLVLVGLCFVVFWGTFFPLISEAVTGTKASVGPPWFNQYTVPLALILVLLSGIGPVIAWRRATAANARRNFVIPVLFGGVAIVALLVAGVGRKPLALVLFAFAAFVLGSIGQELVRGVRARRAMSGDSIPGAAVSLVRRNRRRWGGYTVHIGIAVLFVGVAASSAFQHARDVTLSPGQSARVGGYDVRYVRPTSAVAHDPRGTGAILDLGATLDVSKHGEHVATLNPARGYYPSQDISAGGVGRLVAGESTSEVGLKAGFTRDIWTAVEPDFAKLQPLIDRGNKVVPVVRPDLGLLALAAIAHRYAQRPPPATFRFIVSPMVTWIWLGGLIIGGGAVFALWPAPDVARRRATAGLRARVAHELGRA